MDLIFISRSNLVVDVRPHLLAIQTKLLEDKRPVIGGTYISVAEGSNTLDKSELSKAPANEAFFAIKQCSGSSTAELEDTLSASLVYRKVLYPPDENISTASHISFSGGSRARSKSLFLD